MVTPIPVEPDSPPWFKRFVLRLMDVLNALSNATLASFKVGALGNYANDAAAEAGGVAVGALYRNGSAIQVRVS
jgi:hypothetical protein